MSAICGADCAACPTREDCRGCAETCGRPFGGRCIAAEYIKTGGRRAYDEYKKKLLDEVNELLEREGICRAERLYELAGRYVNLEYTVPSGEKIKLLSDDDIYLGTQIEYEGIGVCCGVVAGADFILVCSYGVNGSSPEIVIYKRR